MIPIIIGLCASVALFVAYRVSKAAWPDTYFDSTDRSSKWHQADFIKLLLWRSVPYALAAALVVKVSAILSVSSVTAQITLLFLHFATTNGLMLARNAAKGETKSQQFIYGGILFALLLSISLSMIFFQDWVLTVTPGLRALVDGFWTAVIVGVLFAVYRVAMSSSRDHSEDLGQTLGVPVDQYYIGYAVQASKIHNVDPILILSILSVESKNRPRVWRFIELTVCRLVVNAYRFVRAAGRLIRLRKIEAGKYVKARFVGMCPKTLGVAQSSLSKEFFEQRINGCAVSLEMVDLWSIDKLAKTLSGSTARAPQQRLTPAQVMVAGNRINKTTPFLREISLEYNRLHVSELRAHVLVIQDENLGAWRSVVEAGNSISVGLPWVVRYKTSLYLVNPIGHSCDLTAGLTYCEDERIIKKEIRSIDSGASVEPATIIEPVGNRLIVTYSIGGVRFPQSFEIYISPEGGVDVGFSTDDIGLGCVADGNVGGG